MENAAIKDYESKKEVTLSIEQNNGRKEVFITALDSSKVFSVGELTFEGEWEGNSHTIKM